MPPRGHAGFAGMTVFRTSSVSERLTRTCALLRDAAHGRESASIAPAMKVEVQAVAPTGGRCRHSRSPADRQSGLAETAQAVDARARRPPQQLLQEGELSGATSATPMLVHVGAGCRPRVIAVAGLGPARLDRRRCPPYRGRGGRAGGGPVRRPRSRGLDSSLPVSVDEQARALVEGTAARRVRPRPLEARQPASRG